MKTSIEEYGFTEVEQVPPGARAKSTGRDLVEAFLESGAAVAKKPGESMDDVVREYNRVYYAIRRGKLPATVYRRGTDLYLVRKGGEAVL